VGALCSVSGIIYWSAGEDLPSPPINPAMPKPPPDPDGAYEDEAVAPLAPVGL